MLRSRSLSISALLTYFIVPLFLVVLPVRGVHAQTVIPGVTCSMVNGVDVCTQQGTGGQVCISDATSQTCENLVTGGDTSSGSSGSLGTGLGQTNQQPSGGPSSGWLSQLSWGIAGFITSFFDAIVGFLHDLVTYVLSVVLGVVSAAISAIGTPQWLSNYSMGSILGQTGPIVGFFLSELNVGTALTLIGAGYVFRLTRKFLTLFQW